MRLVVHREIPESDALKRQWDDLVLQMESPEVFYTYEWAAAVQRAYSASITPLLILAYEQDSLIGVAAFATDSTGDKIFFLGSATADYCDFVSRPESREGFVDAVFCELKRSNAAALTLANLPSDSVTCEKLRCAARKQHYWQFFRPAYLCAQVAIDSPPRRQSSLQSVRRRMRRYAKALPPGTPITFSHSNSWDEIGALLPRFAQAHVARFLASGRISNLAAPERRLFLEELAKSFSSTGTVSFSRMLAGEQTVAWNYGFQFAGSWFWYQPTFDGNFQQYSPGLWLLSKIVEQAGENPSLNRVDLGLGAELYKDRLATTNRQTLHVTLAASAFDCSAERVRYHAAAAVRRVPGLEGWMRRQWIRLQSLRRQAQFLGFQGCLKSSARRLGKSLFHESQIVLLEWPRDEPSGTEASPTMTIRPLDLDLLAVAAMRYAAEDDTLAYLLQAADRLRSDKSQGLALVSAAGTPVHFCWKIGFEDFYSPELETTLTAPSPDAVVLCDCWTPQSVRGQGFYQNAISRIASQLRIAGKAAWIIASTTNRAAFSGAEHAGFVQRASSVRRRILFVNRIAEPQRITKERVHEVSSAA
jgi:CelD/BcsL family acetyltransferase involved in cellulose biosynthesis